MISERFIVVSGVNGTELLRSLAKHGQKQFATRITSPVELARHALSHQGHFISGIVITPAEETAVMVSAMTGNGYFSDVSFADTEAVTNSLNTLRRLITENEHENIKQILSEGPFKEKNAALLAIYEKYLAICKKDNLTDGISLIREAIERCSPLAGQWLTIEEFPLTPLEEHLSFILSGGKLKSTNILELLQLDKTTTRIGSITEAYGISNEVESILAHMLRESRPFDNCVVAVTNTAEYSQHFFDLAQRYSMSVTFGCGVPILNANPAKLLKLINQWQSEGYCGIDALKSIVYSDVFERGQLEKLLPEELETTTFEMIKMSGNMRLSMDASSNAEKIANLRSVYNKDAITNKRALDTLAFAESVFLEFAKGFQYLIQKYSVIRTWNSHQSKIDRSSIKVIGEALGSLIKFGMYEDIPRMIPILLKKTVSSENCREGYLHVTSVNSAKYTLRKHLYIAGLGAKFFPGTPRENPILLDDDFEPLKGVVQEKYIPTSENIITNKMRSLHELIYIYSAMGEAPRMAFSGFDLSELKIENPSSALFELYCEAQLTPADATFEAFEKKIEHVGFFSSIFSIAHGIGRGYLEGKQLLEENKHFAEDPVECSKLEFSPSAIETYFVCPRKFLLTKLLGIRIQEEDDPFIWMDARTRGTLAHTVMEETANKRLSKEAFMEVVYQHLEVFSMKRPPISDSKKEIDEFCAMMERAYDTDPKNEVIFSEEKISAPHPSGICIYGKPDRLEKTPDGRFIIVDFKTGLNVQHIVNDPSTCLQTLLYAFLYEHNGIHVDSCEYRYIRHGESVKCSYDFEMKEQLNTMLDEFIAALRSGDFPPQDANCRYCDIKDICGGNLRG